jgi:hypothetical protein
MEEPLRLMAMQRDVGTLEEANAVSEAQPADRTGGLAGNAVRFEGGDRWGYRARLKLQA